MVFHIDEGEQIFVRNVLLTGLHFTRPETVARAITVHAGDPLNQTALSDTQRNLYAFSLFNEVDTAVQNPNGSEPEKTVLLQAVGGAALDADLRLRLRGANRAATEQLRRRYRGRRPVQPQR